MNQKTKKARAAKPAGAAAGAGDVPAARSCPPVILHVIPRLEGGGAETVMIALAGAAVKAGARVFVLSEGGALVPLLRATGAEWRRFPAATKNPARILANAFALARFIRTEKVALVHAHSRAPAWSALIAARRSGVPLVTSHHGAHAYQGPFKALYNSVMARGDAVIANSGYTAATIRTHHPFAAGRMSLIHCGVDTDRFDRARIARNRISALRRKWQLGDRDSRIVVVPARLSPRKGHETAIEAVRLLRERGMSHIAMLFLGGDRGEGGYAAHLEARIAEAGLARHVRLAGFSSDMALAYAAADLVLVPSREPESFGLVAAEAGAMGVPVVVSETGALPEIVLAPPDVPEHRRTGWRVPPGDAAALADAIAAALAMDGRARAALARRARAHVLASFSLARMTEETLSVYDRVHKMTAHRVDKD